jgi:hypothetical protein
VLTLVEEEPGCADETAAGVIGDVGEEEPQAYAVKIEVTVTAAIRVFI